VGGRALFEPDNIRHGDSIDNLKNFGKIEGLEAALHTNYRVAPASRRRASTRTPRTTTPGSRPTAITNPS
jgi:hypothetical protein